MPAYSKQGFGLPLAPAVQAVESITSDFYDPIMEAQVHCYFLKGTQGAPNSRLPVLVYKNAITSPISEESATRLLTANQWEKRVGSFPGGQKEEDT